MRVLHVIDSGGLYGAENMLLDLATEQRRMGLDPIIASIGEKDLPEKPLEREARRRGVAVEPFRMMPGPNFPGAMEILAYSRRKGCRLLHSHGYKGNILFGLMPRKCRRIPLVGTLHGWTCTGGVTRMRLYEWLDGFSLRRFDAVVLVSAGMRNHPRMGRHEGKIRSCVIPNGISPLMEDGVLLPQQIRDFCRGGFTIGAIGRLSPEKGFASLLEALKMARERFPELKLVIVGEGGQREDLERKVRELGLGSRVLLPGYLPEARRCLPCFDLFVLSSLTEGLPMTLLEAMQAGVPVLATPVGGIPEVLEEGRAGMLAGSSAAEDLAAGLIGILEDREGARRRAEWARTRVNSEYSSRTMAERYREVYRTAMEGAGA